MRHHFIRAYINNGTATIKFVHLGEKLADTFTNNLSNVLFESLTSSYVHCE